MFLEESDATAIDTFIQAELDLSLLQSWTWGEFQKELGRDIARVGIKRDGQLVASALLVKSDLPLGLKYVYVPRGPVIKGTADGNIDTQALKDLNAEIVEVAKKWNAVFVRVDAPVSKDSASHFAELGYKSAASEVQPKVTALLDLSKDREELLAGMKSKARYNIRLAGRKGVTIRESIDPKDTQAFLDIYKVTTERNKFFAHDDDYYRKQFDHLGKAGLLKLFVAEYEAKPIAVIVVALHGKTAIYLHGASSNAERNRMPTFLVHWEAIKKMQTMGLKWYDFHGVAPTDDRDHPWSGITRFKMGFGAQRVEYMGALDLPLKKLSYSLYAARLRMRKSDGR